MSKEEYAPLNGFELGDDGVDYHDGDVPARRLQRRSTVSRTLISYLPTIAICLVCIVASCLTGYWYGRSTTNYVHGNILNPDIRPQAFKYNRTMAEAPTDENDAMWEEMFPPHGGFFHHETLAPDGASLAAFHQLHCLNGIRHAYWEIHGALVENRTLDFDSLPEYSQPWHTRHCIDFLRQMLMCNADITIEYVKPELGGIVGFGVEHQCRDWSQMYDWVRDKQIKWESQPGHERSNATKIVPDADEDTESR